MVWAGVGRRAFLVWVVHRRRIFRVLGAGRGGRRDSVVLVWTASVGEVVGLRAFLRICIFALLAGEVGGKEPVRLIVTIDLAQRCAVRRGSCTLMWKTAKVGAACVSGVRSLGSERMLTCEYAVRCPSLCNRATSWI